MGLWRIVSVGGVWLCAGLTLPVGSPMASSGAAPVVTTESPLAAAFGNTVVSRYADGGWVKHWFERDGDYSAEFSDGRRIRGVWRIEGERLCLNDIQPSIMLIRRFCSPLVSVRTGQTWPSRDPLGRRVQNEIMAGR